MSGLYTDKNIAQLEANGFTLSQDVGVYVKTYIAQKWWICGELFTNECYFHSPDGNKTFANFEELWIYLEKNIFEYTSDNPKYERPNSRFNISG